MADDLEKGVRRGAPVTLLERGNSRPETLSRREMCPALPELECQKLEKVAVSAQVTAIFLAPKQHYLKHKGQHEKQAVQAVEEAAVTAKDVA